MVLTSAMCEYLRKKELEDSANIRGFHINNSNKIFI